MTTTARRGAGRVALGHRPPGRCAWGCWGWGSATLAFARLWRDDALQPAAGEAGRLAAGEDRVHLGRRSGGSAEIRGRVRGHGRGVAIGDPRRRRRRRADRDRKRRGGTPPRFSSRGADVYRQADLYHARGRRTILGTAQRHGTPLFSTSSARYSPAVALLRSLIASGDLGTLLAMQATAALDPGLHAGAQHLAGRRPAGGGTIVNMGIHGMEPLVALLGLISSP